ncbi:hypothetical protein [Novosphingobium sp. BW1]|uniref:hypothetical protein n=1 Tax=Novosphingobium sp. BW1 TaxID=2592621 RepID=UPI0011DED593|nr:hypothetical protein [Novosphingobium sp. BW1]TYC93061.1 hypothetical protein FMM79_03480 [Novosphingobium sp. BW1]
MKRTVMFCLTVALAAALSACAHDPVSTPARADIEALVEPKPTPGPEILTDPNASARHNAAIEGWGDRIHAAGARLCRFFDAQGADLNCPA